MDQGGSSPGSENDGTDGCVVTADDSKYYRSWLGCHSGNSSPVWRGIYTYLIGRGAGSEQRIKELVTGGSSPGSENDGTDDRITDTGGNNDYSG